MSQRSYIAGKAYQSKVSLSNPHLKNKGDYLYHIDLKADDDLVRRFKDVKVVFRYECTQKFLRATRKGVVPPNYRIFLVESEG